MKRILAKLTYQGQLLMPPSPSHQLIEDGKPIQNFTLDQIEDLALHELNRLRDPQPLKYDPEEATHGNQR